MQAVVDFQRRQKDIHAMQSKLEMIKKDLDKTYKKVKAEPPETGLPGMRDIYEALNGRGTGLKLESFVELMSLFKKEDEIRDEIRELKRESSLNLNVHRRNMSDQHQLLMDAMQSWSTNASDGHNN